MRVVGNESAAVPAEVMLECESEGGSEGGGGGVPREYGPEFVGAGQSGRLGDICLGDAPLPHIDPRLTLLPPPQPHLPHLPQLPHVHQLPHSPPQRWEPPVYTKYVFADDPARFAVFNTDIF
jgi:hypothetical protein